MNRIQRFVSLIAILSVSLTAYADVNDSIISQSINSSGVIYVNQPQQLENRLKKGSIPTQANQQEDTQEEEADELSQQSQRKIGGYRVQVFSDNNPRTAKNEARAKAKQVSQAFRQYRAYVVFNAPYWRLRVGDFRTQEEAEAAATLIKKQFPGYSREVRVVRDRINVAK